MRKITRNLGLTSKVFIATLLMTIVTVDSFAQKKIKKGKVIERFVKSGVLNKATKPLNLTESAILGQVEQIKSQETK